VLIEYNTKVVESFYHQHLNVEGICRMILCAHRHRIRQTLNTNLLGLLAFTSSDAAINVRTSWRVPVFFLNKILLRFIKYLLNPYLHFLLLNHSNYKLASHFFFVKNKGKMFP